MTGLPCSCWSLHVNRQHSNSNSTLQHSRMWRTHCPHSGRCKRCWRATMQDGIQDPQQSISWQMQRQAMPRCQQASQPAALVLPPCVRLDEPLWLCSCCRPCQDSLAGSSCVGQQLQRVSCTSQQHRHVQASCRQQHTAATRSCLHLGRCQCGDNPTATPEPTNNARPGCSRWPLQPALHVAPVAPRASDSGWYHGAVAGGAALIPSSC